MRGVGPTNGGVFSKKKVLDISILNWIGFYINPFEKKGINQTFPTIIQETFHNKEIVFLIRLTLSLIPLLIIAVDNR